MSAPKVNSMAADRPRYTFDQIVTANPAMEEVKRLALLAARAPSTPVLLLGETGTGKEMFAHAIHAGSRRRTGPLVAVNCAAVPESLIEAEFFGYEEGAFTGARRGGKPGLFERAHGGTLFLDEVSEMPALLQAKLLRAVQTGEVERVGGMRPIQADVRVVAASNRDLEGMVGEGRFRADLYYRLSVINLQLPPLRERREDILPLARAVLAELVPGTPPPLEADAARALVAHDWPGNVRELRNVLERAIVLYPGQPVSARALPAHLQGDPGCSRYRRRMATAEREAIEEALRRAGGNRSRAARLLGISRSTFYEKWKRNA